ncbi:MAG: hypothetical protein JO297_19275 [Nitrososphaeraceae archaeon]|nr:hypothetical protein [Nitrososphaeraceae archaeon]
MEIKTRPLFIIIIIGIITIVVAIEIYNYTYNRPQRPSITIGVSVDRFGIRELYPTKKGGEEWFMNMDDPNHDPRAGKGEGPSTTFVQRNDYDGSWKVENNEVRYGALTSSGYNPQLITTLNQQDLAAKGYMQSPNDWKNVEMTGYLKVNSFSDSTRNGAAHIEFLARGGRNTNEQTEINGLPLQCEGTTYHSNTYETGRVKFEKDLMHTQGYTSDSQDPQLKHATNNLEGRWIGIKAVFYNLPNGSVKLEQWLDDSTNNINTPGNQWHKVLEYSDDGNWGGGQNDCGGTDTTIITWGGPIAIFRWDNIDDMDVKDLSVREIQP